MTIYDISQKAGVSIATVSRVLNGNTNVSAKTRQKVMDVIEEYGYSPNVFARGLGLDSMNCVGILARILPISILQRPYIILNKGFAQTDTMRF